jgi:hypothetical protein
VSFSAKIPRTGARSRSYAGDLGVDAVEVDHGPDVVGQRRARVERVLAAHAEPDHADLAARGGRVDVEGHEEAERLVGVLGELAVPEVGRERGVAELREALAHLLTMSPLPSPPPSGRAR